MRYIACCSCGKDSLAMVLKLINEEKPLTEVVFYDTGMEFESIYNNWNKLCTILDKFNIKHTVLKPALSFEYEAFEKPVKNRNKGGYHYGYSWCGGVCRWGTHNKLSVMDKYCESQDSIVYIGIATDEQTRIARNKKDYKRFPLVEFGMTEQECLKYCREMDFEWSEPSCNGIDLYAVLDRVSCWCCANKNKKELRNIYTYLPYYWEKLKDFQRKTDRPMKKYKKNGQTYGTVFELEEMFKNEGGDFMLGFSRDDIRILNGGQ